MEEVLFFFFLFEAMTQQKIPSVKSLFDAFGDEDDDVEISMDPSYSEETTSKRLQNQNDSGSEDSKTATKSKKAKLEEGDDDDDEVPKRTGGVIVTDDFEKEVEKEYAAVTNELQPQPPQQSDSGSTAKPANVNVNHSVRRTRIDISKPIT